METKLDNFFLIFHNIF